MKKIILYLMLLVLPAASFCQQTSQAAPVFKTDYLKKSKNQKTAAWILLGSGASMIVLSSVIWSNAVENSNDFFAPWTTTKGTGLATAGFLTMAGSIPLFISASKNKKRAEAVSTSFKMETLPEVPNGLFTSTAIPALSIKINL